MCKWSEVNVGEVVLYALIGTQCQHCSYVFDIPEISYKYLGHRDWDGVTVDAFRLLSEFHCPGCDILVKINFVICDEGIPLPGIFLKQKQTIGGQHD